MKKIFITRFYQSFITQLLCIGKSGAFIRIFDRCLIIAILCFTVFNTVNSQTIQVGVMPKQEIAHATGNAFMHFPRATGFDIENGSGDIVKKVLVSWAVSADNPSLAPVYNQLYSENGGTTYGSILTSNTNVDFVSSIRRRNGTVLEIPFKPVYPVPLGSTFTFDYRTSTDNGNTWTTNTNGLVDYGAQAVNGMRFHRGIIEEDDGTLYAAAYAAFAGQPGWRSVLLQSTNSGATWTLKSTIASSGTISYDETTIERCSNGNWLAVFREASYMPLRYSRSTNKGVSWSTPAYLPGLGGTSTSGDDLNESVDPHLMLMPNGILVLSYGRPNVHVAFSTDGNGTTWTNVNTTLTEVPGTLGAESSNYAALVPITAHRLLQIGDTGADWSYPANPSPNPFSVWSKSIDIVRPQQNRIDLETKYSLGTVTIMPATTLTYTDAAHPEARTSGAFDGSTDYWSGALGTTSGIFQIDLQKIFNINAIGLAMLYGKQQSATVQYSTDAISWSSPVVTYTNAIHYALNYTNVTAFNARYIRVNASGIGQIGLSELELYEASSTFENNAAAASNNPHGIIPAGYTSNGTSSTQYGVSIADGTGYQSNRAMKLYDGSSTWYAGVKKIVTASNLKTLEFRCRIAALPAGTSFNVPIKGTVSGVENTVFWVAFFANSTGTAGIVKVHNGTAWVALGTVTLPVSGTVWTLIKIAANESSNTASMYINGVQTGAAFSMSAAPASATNLTGFAFQSNGTATYGELIYFDDVNFYDPTTGSSSGVAKIVSHDIAVTNLTKVPKNQDFLVSVSPNPANGFVKVKIQGALKGALDLYFVDMSGKTLKRLNYKIEGGTSFLDIPIQEFLPGKYIITLKQNNRFAQIKLVVLNL